MPSDAQLQPGRNGGPPDHLRVFVSSTFQDLQVERDALVRHAFPRLRALCASRGVGFSEVDLRWGITDDERLRGLVIPICFSEIAACRPYFIGILGHRYGWCPEPEHFRAAPELSKRLEGLLGRSMTELEFRYAGLGSPTPQADLRFYLARPSQERQSALAQSEEDVRRLERLRADIQASGHPWREFSTPEELSLQVLADFTALLERDFPPGSGEEQDRHRYFATLHARRHHGRQRALSRLKRHALREGPPLLVRGPEGIGKTGLLARWVVDAHARPPTLPTWRGLLSRVLGQDESQRAPPRILSYFAGATPGDATWPQVLRHWMRALGAEPEAGAAGDTGLLREHFLAVLSRAAETGPIVLVLDGMDQLERRGQAGEFLWLPESLPRNVRLIGSARAGPSATRLQELGWRVLELGGLDASERVGMTQAVLAPFRKHLKDDLQRQLLGREATTNPRYLWLLLEEMRQFPAHEELSQRTGAYLTETRIEALAVRILHRVRADASRFRGLFSGALEPERVMREALLALLCARDGLEETELYALLGSEREPLPPAAWSFLRLQLQELLTCRSGRWGLAHDAARAAVEQVFAPSARERALAHRRLSDFFARHAATSTQAAEACLWHLARAGDGAELARRLSDPELLVRLWEWEPLGVLSHWAELERSGVARPEAVYRSLLEAPATHPEAARCVGQLLLRMGHYPAAERLWRSLAEGTTGAARGTALGHLALACLRLGKHAEAWELLRAQECTCARPEPLQACLGNQAALLLELERYEEAEALLLRAEQLSASLPGTPGLARARANRALLARRREAPEAAGLLESAERSARRLGDAPALLICLGLRAAEAGRKGQWSRAARHHAQQERLCRALGDRAELQRCLGQQVAVLLEQGDYGSAAEKLSERRRVCEQLGDARGRAECARQEHVLRGNLGLLG